MLTPPPPLTPTATPPPLHLLLFPHSTHPVLLSFTLTCAYASVLSLTPSTLPPSSLSPLLRVISQVDWPLNIIITDSCMNKYNRLFSFLLQLKHMVWSLREVWFHLKRTGESPLPPPVPNHTHKHTFTHAHPIHTLASAVLPRRETLDSFPLCLNPR